MEKLKSKKEVKKENKNNPLNNLLLVMLISDKKSFTGSRFYRKLNEFIKKYVKNKSNFYIHFKHYGNDDVNHLSDEIKNKIKSIKSKKSSVLALVYKDVIVVDDVKNDINIVANYINEFRELMIDKKKYKKTIKTINNTKTIKK